MAISSPITRRGLLVTGAAGAGLAVVAACSGGSSGSSGSGGDSQSSAGGTPAADPTTPAESSSAASSGQSSGSSSAGSSSAGGAASDALTALSDLTVGEPVTVELPGGKPGLLTRTSSTAAVCFSAICTHEGCTVKPDGKQLACPCHGSTFEAATGKVLGGPAPSALPAVKVKVVDGQVVPA